MDYIPPGSSVHGILQSEIVEWVATLFSRESSWPRDQTQVYCIAGRFLTIWATRETSLKVGYILKAWRRFGEVVKFNIKITSFINDDVFESMKYRSLTSDLLDHVKFVRLFIYF